MRSTRVGRGPTFRGAVSTPTLKRVPSEQRRGRLLSRAARVNFRPQSRAGRADRRQRSQEPECRRLTSLRCSAHSRFCAISHSHTQLTSSPSKPHAMESSNQQPPASIQVVKAKDPASVLKEQKQAQHEPQSAPAGQEALHLQAVHGLYALLNGSSSGVRLEHQSSCMNSIY